MRAALLPPQAEVEALARDGLAQDDQLLQVRVLVLQTACTDVHVYGSSPGLQASQPSLPRIAASPWPASALLCTHAQPPEVARVPLSLSPLGCAHPQALAHPASHELPWFAGAHVYPLYPGSAAK